MFASPLPNAASRRLALSIVALLLLQMGCTGVRQMVGAALDYDRADWPEERARLDLAYRAGPDFDDEKHRLDLYLPAEGEAGWPTLVFVHGGGWTSGDRRLGALGIEPIRNVGRFYAARGFGVVLPSYRLQPDVDWRTQVDDVSAAIAWAREAAAKHGGDPSAIFLGGHSAGAWLAARVGLADAPLAGYDVDRGSLCGLVLVSGAAYDLADEVTYERGASRSYFEQRFDVDPNDPEWKQTASVVPNVESPSPPALVLSAEGEGPTFERQGDLLYAKLEEVAPRSRRQVIPGQNHQRILVSMSLAGDPVSDAALAFMRDVPCGAAAR